MKVRVQLLLVLLTLSVMATSAADVTGKWVAQMPGRDGGTQEITFALKMEGGKLTGTMSTGQREQTISEGQVSGDTISFAIVQSRGGTDFKTIYKGTVSGAEMKLTRTREGGRGGGGRGGQPQEIVAKKVG
ncbi:MAG: hypothetical protein IT159_12080 [Bryobacterales bacterium]|nr:hypothetical protein [Bryobacterales bacterium]